MASELIPNITRNQIVENGLNIVILSAKNNSTFKAGKELYLRASRGSKPQEKIFNEIAEVDTINEYNRDDNGDVYATIEKVTKFQVSTYDKEDKQFDIFINDVYLSRSEQKEFLNEQGFSEDEFLDKYGVGMYQGYLIKFNL